MESSVVFPAPFGPSRPVIPAPISKIHLVKRHRPPVPAGEVLERMPELTSLWFTSASSSPIPSEVQYPTARREQARRPR